LSHELLPSASKAEAEDSDNSSSSASSASSWGIVDDYGDDHWNNLRDFIVGCIRESVGKLNRLAIVIRSGLASTSTPADLVARVRGYASRHLAQDVARLEISFKLTLQFLYPDADDSFKRQLLKSAIFRFAKLRYWQRHQKKLESDIRQNEEPTPGSSLDTPTPHLDDVSRRDAKDGKETRPISVAPSSTNLSMSKAAMRIEESEAPASRTEEGNRRRGGTSVWMSTARYPEAPPVDLNSSHDQTMCPYCCKRQEDEVFTNGKWWECVVWSPKGVA